MSNDKVIATFGKSSDLGMSGTRDGMSIKQLETFERLLAWELVKPGAHTWHDGDCLGSDEQGLALVTKFKRDWAIVERHGHPCNLKQFRAHGEYDVMHPIYPPLVRNRHIVLSCTTLFFTPAEYTEVFRGSGTWATIRYAQKVKRPHYLIWPDGQYEDRTQPEEALL